MGYGMMVGVVGDVGIERRSLGLVMWFLVGGVIALNATSNGIRVS